MDRVYVFPFFGLKVSNNQKSVGAGSEGGFFYRRTFMQFRSRFPPLKMEPFAWRKNDQLIDAPIVDQSVGRSFIFRRMHQCSIDAGGQNSSV